MEAFKTICLNNASGLKKIINSWQIPRGLSPPGFDHLLTQIWFPNDNLHQKDILVRWEFQQTEPSNN